MPRKKKPNKEHAPGGLYSGLRFVRPGKSGWYIYCDKEQVDGPYMDRGEAELAKQWYEQNYKAYYRNKHLKLGSDNEFCEN